MTLAQEGTGGQDFRHDCSNKASKREVRTCQPRTLTELGEQLINESRCRHDSLSVELGSEPGKKNTTSNIYRAIVHTPTSTVTTLVKLSTM